MSLISLNKISSVTANIVKINWFKNVGKEIDSNLYSFIKNYCQELNIHNEIKQVANWEEAIKVINSKDWAIAVEKGRWSTHVRQHTYDRSHFLYENC